MSAEFLITALIVVLAPGTGVIYTVATGLTRGAPASLSAALGCTLGIVPHIAASILGLAAVLHASATAFQAVKIAGVLYLFYLAWGMWRDAKRSDGADAFTRPAPSAQPQRHGAIAFKGVLLNILNPKLSIFFLAFLPQFVDPASAHPARDMMGLSAVFMGLTLGVFVLYGLFAAGVRQQIVTRPRALAWIKRSFAATFAALGVKLALTER